MKTIYVLCLLIAIHVGQSRSDISSIKPLRLEKNCGKPPLVPLGSRTLCVKINDRINCNVTCQAGYKFPRNNERFVLFCDINQGIWKPTDINVPDCVPICKKDCLNGGKCAAPDTCICPRGFRGSLCEYPISNCRPYTEINSLENWRCNHTSSQSVCTVSCPKGSSFKSVPKAEYFTCDLQGNWTPKVLPKCILNFESQFAIPQVLSVKKSGTFSSGVCSVWNHYNYRTFDGKFYKINAECTLLLTKDCTADTFQIHLKNKKKGRTIIVYVSDIAYKLFHGKNGTVFKVGSERVKIPTEINGFSVDKVADYIVLSNNGLGFRVQWDKEFSVTVTVDKKIVNKTCGLCGNYDNDVNNDFETSQGKITSDPVVFVNSWKMLQIGEVDEEVTKIDQYCKTDTKEEKELAQLASIDCAKILSSHYSACHQVVNPMPYYVSCKADFCNCHNQSCACNTISEYFKECFRLGSRPTRPWRSEKFCSVSCPRGTLYTDCGSSCPLTCKKTSNGCEGDFCIDGCHCPQDKVLFNGKCISHDKCSCEYNEKQYKEGDKVQQDCNNCECFKGKWKCSKLTCEARCSSVSDPTYTTFDGKKYAFYGQCTYYLVYNPTFSIQQENIECSSQQIGSSKFSSCTKAIIVKVDGSELKLLKNFQVTLNGQIVKMLPLSTNSFKVSRSSFFFVSVFLTNGVVVQWDGKSRVYIDVPASLYKLTKGLCGTFNGNQNDDFLTPEGDIESDLLSFAEKWRSVSDCTANQEQLPPPEKMCELNSQRKKSANSYCSKLMQGNFIECNKVLDPSSFYDACMTDMCSCTQTLKECLCETLADYGEQCSKKLGKGISWRHASPECYVTCPGNQIFSTCGIACQRSCADISQNIPCRIGCSEGCACPKGTTLDAQGACVLISQCPCVLGNKEFKFGQKKLINGELCVCQSAKWKCSLVKLKGSPDISPGNLLDNCQGSNMEFVECKDMCKSTCSNLKSPVTCGVHSCQRGCQCKKGFVLDEETSTCVRPKKCSCKHARKFYKSGDKIRLDCNDCVCKGGSWSCDTNQCPGICSVWGDSHYKTFDGKLYGFSGSCDYILAQGQKGGRTFVISVQNIPCGTTGVACNKAVSILLDNSKRLTLEVNSPLPTNIMEDFILRDVGMFLYVHTNIGMSIQWDKGTRIYVRLSPGWKNKVQGLCGNFNDDQADEFMTPFGGMSETDILAFGDSWKLHDYCLKPKLMKDPCDIHPNRLTWATSQCSVLLSDNFKPCHAYVPVEDYYKNCVSDSCACDSGGDCHCLCTAIATYAQECAGSNVHIKWRSQKLCPIQCDSRCSEYETCLSPCPKPACGNQVIVKALMKVCKMDICVEGCSPPACKPGEVYNNEIDYKCVPVSQCKIECKKLYGITYYEGDKITDSRVVDQCQTCHCQQGAIGCVGKPCTTVPVTPTTQTSIVTEIMTPSTLVPYPQVGVSCKRSGWTSWMNSYKADKTGDHETLGNLRKKYAFCSDDQIIDVQCRGSIPPLTKLSNNFNCTHKGLECVSSATNWCSDYEIRFYCRCNKTECNSPRGMESGTIKTIQITKTYSKNPLANGRLNSANPWIPKISDVQQWISIDLTEVQKITGLITQGNAYNDDRVTLYTIEYGTDKDVMKPLVNENTGKVVSFEGNVKSVKPVTVMFPSPIDTRYVTIKPVLWVGKIALRFEILGCEIQHVTPFVTTPIIPTTYSRAPKVTTQPPLFTTPKITTTSTIYYTTAPSPTSTTFVQFTTRPTPKICGWTQWFDVDNPLMGNGDIESISKIRKSHALCKKSNIIKVECGFKEDKNSKEFTDYKRSTDFGLKCSTERGFACLNWLQKAGRICKDYAVRFYCYCPHLNVTTPTITQTTPSVCPTGYVYDTCAIDCKQTCQSFQQDLIAERKCDPRTKVCVPGCKPESGCSSPYVWKDYQTCVHPTECTCKGPHGLMIPDSQIEMNCKICECKDNTITCKNVEGCNVTGIPQKQTSAIPTTQPTRTTVPLCKSYRTKYFNSAKPTNGAGDIETPSNIALSNPNRAICAAGWYASKIECVTDVMIGGSKTTVDYKKSDDVNVVCSLKEGLLCYNYQQKRKVCRDYKVRFLCDCLPKTAVPPTVPSVCGWSGWLNVDKPNLNNAGDLETIDKLRAKYGLCDKSHIKMIECRLAVTKHPYRAAGQKNLVCNENVGFKCFNRDQVGRLCHDYEVNVYCDSPTCRTAPPTERTTAVPYTTSTPVLTTLPQPPPACPDGYVWDNCAFDCRFTCQSLQQLLMQSKECDLDNKFCIARCRPVTECNSPYVWRDFDTCVTTKDCTCQGPNGIMAPNSVIEYNCKKCQCVNNLLECYPIPGCYRTTQPVTETTTSTSPAVPTTQISRIPILKPDCWTEWINTDNATTSGGDFEELSNLKRLYEFCDHPIAVECRDAVSGVSSLATGQQVSCTVEKGLQCWNALNAPNGCKDYKIRFYCPCRKPTTPITVVVTTPTVPCVPGWTGWMSKNQANDEGDTETYEELVKSGYDICPRDMITSIECGQIQKTLDESEQVSADLQPNVVCNLKDGVVCKSSEVGESKSCANYALRFFCTCPTLPPSSTIRTTLKTTTPPVPKITTPSTPYVVETTTTIVPCTPGWTEWINNREPNKGDETEGYEIALSAGVKLCAKNMITSIECGKVKILGDGKQKIVKKLQKNVVCSIADGLVCLKSELGFFKTCDDYAVRFYCSCPSAPPPPLPPIETTTAIVPCTPGWTEWINNREPIKGDETEGYEIALSAGVKLCAKNMITSVECGRVKILGNGKQKIVKKLQKNVVCSVTDGLVCLKSELGFFKTCDDYAIRFYCSCPTAPPPTTLPPSLPTETTVTETTAQTTVPPVPTTPPPTTPYPVETTTAIVPCTPGWTEWINNREPIKGDETEGYEIALSAGVKLCAKNMITSVECGRVKILGNGKQKIVKKLQKNVVCSVVDGLVCLKSELGLFKTCDDYAIRFFCSCPTAPTTLSPSVPTETTVTEITQKTTLPPVPTTTPYSVETTTAIVPCTPGWTEWINNREPIKGDETEGYEIALSAGVKLCAKNMITSVECGRVKILGNGKQKIVKKLQKNVVCSVTDGLVCLKSELGFFKTCDDYAIRFYCSCPTAPPPTTLPPSVPTETTVTEITQKTTLPPVPTTTPYSVETTTAIVPCTPGWTEWINTREPIKGDESEGYEIALSAGVKLCAKNMITSVECGRVKILGNGKQKIVKKLQKNVVCSVTDGLVCLKSELGLFKTCDDYAIRFFCSCPTAPPPTTLPPSVPTETTVTEITQKTTLPPVPTTTPYSVETTTAIVPCTPGWTEWINTREPIKGDESEGYEIALSAGVKLCAKNMITSVECGRVKILGNGKQKIVKKLQRNVVCSVTDGLVCLKSELGLFKTCDDYAIRFFCSCPTAPPPPTTLPPIETTTTIVPCTPGWTEWINNREPIKGDETEGYEIALSAGVKLCAKNMITSVECGRVKMLGNGKQKIVKKLQKNVVCSVTDGLVCLKTELGFFKTCDDYAIRFYCSCPTASPPTTLPPSVSTETMQKMTTPPVSTTTPVETTTVVVPCTPGWTDWINSREPIDGDETEGYEIALSAGVKLCTKDMITSVECGKVKILGNGKQKITKKLQENVVCSIADGLVCLKSEMGRFKTCEDYAIRFYCSCPTAAPPTMLPPSVSTGPTVTQKIPTCNEPLGMENGRIPDSALNATSYEFVGSMPKYGRLNTKETKDHTGAWISAIADSKQFYQIDLGGIHTITGIVTQGRNTYDEYVTSYIAYYGNLNSGSAITWHLLNPAGKKVFSGNFDGDTPVTNYFGRDVRARYIRIVPVTYEGWIAMRIEIHGCVKPTTPTITEAVTTQVTLTTQTSLPPISETTTPTWMTRQTTLSTPPTTELPKQRLCTGLNVIDSFKCPFCSDGTACDGKKCVEPVDCPCYSESGVHQVGDSFIDIRCQKCFCFMRGLMKCEEINCTQKCDSNEAAIKSDTCDCTCRGCPENTILCPTSNVCIKKSLWCDGIEDCPDDEKNCNVTVPCKKYNIPWCSPGTKLEVVDPTAHCLKYHCVSVNKTVLPEKCRTDDADSSAKCELSGSYLVTFDGFSYNVDVCRHILLNDRKSKKFRVEIVKDCSKSKHCSRYLYIKVDGHVLTVDSDLTVKYKGNVLNRRGMLALSRNNPDIDIIVVGSKFIFKSIKYHWDVYWDSNTFVKIVVSDCLLYQLNGLCGFYSDEEHDDKEMSNLKLTDDTDKFVRSWSVGDQRDCKPSLCSKSSRIIAEATCKRLLGSTFSKCIDAMGNADRFLAACTSSLCQCTQSSTMEQCQCVIFLPFVSQCESRLGKELTNWRIQMNCAPPKCPPGLEWRDCGPGCEKTCENFRSDKSCKVGCVAGCFCPAGLVRVGDSCTTPDHCSDCECKGHGDPNFITFDGRYYAFQGNCTYVLAEDRTGRFEHKFKVLITNVECPEEPGTTCAKGLTVKYGGSVVKIFYKSPVVFNGKKLKQVDLPFKKDGISVTSMMDGDADIYVAKINLMVRYRSVNYGFYVSVPSKLFFNETEGLCGVCNFDSSDDLYHKDGHVEEDVEKFAYSWLIDDSRGNCTIPSRVVPTLPPNVCNFTVNPCTDVVDPTVFQRSCYGDVSHSVAPSKSLCRAMMQYAYQCCRAGISLSDWLKSSSCDQSCPAGMDYRCNGGCLATCDNIDKPCFRPPEYDCFCPPGEVLKKGRCVNETFCRTCDKEGHTVNDVWTISKCETCHCTETLSVKCIKEECQSSPPCPPYQILQQKPPKKGRCCGTYYCKPRNTTLCPELNVPRCNASEITQLKIVKGCPRYKCECEPSSCPFVGLPTPEQMEQGQVYRYDRTGCCEKLIYSCDKKRCPPAPDCPVGSDVKRTNGSCCTTYECKKKPVCVYVDDKSIPVEYKVGDAWSDGLCKKCKCVINAARSITYVCDVKSCQTPSESDLSNYVVAPMPVEGQCCDKYVRKACKLNRKIVKVGETWHPRHNPCLIMSCQLDGDGQAQKKQTDIECSKNCSEGYEYREPSSPKKCCGRCVKTKCIENDKVYDIGDRWNSTLRRCYKVNCVRGKQEAESIYTKFLCQPVSLDCPPDQLVNDESGCCLKCKVATGLCHVHKIRANKTISFFRKEDRWKGSCTNRGTIKDLRVCSGQCKIDIKYQEDMKAFGMNNMMCEVKKFLMKNVTLTCDNGSSVTVRYKNPIRCGCMHCI